MNNGIQIGKTSAKFVVRRVCAVREKFVSQFGLNLRVPR